MAEKVGVLIDVDSSQAVKGLRDTATALDKVGHSGSQLPNGLSPAAAKVDALANAQRRARGSASELAASQHHLVGAARDAAGAVGALNQKLDNMAAAKQHARGLTAEVDQLAVSLGRASLVGVGLGVASVSQFATFDKGMAYAKARLEGTAQQYRELDALAKRLGNDQRMPQFSAGDAGTASGVLAQGGLGMKDILSGAAEASLLAAGALGTDVVQSSQLAADAIRVFNAEGQESIRVIDQMVMASLKGSQSAGELQTALSQSGSVLQMQNRTSLEAATSFALLGKGMVRGGEAGTSLRGMLLRLVPQTKEAAEMMQHLGLKFTDAQGKFLPMERVAGLLHDRLSGLSDAERTTALNVMFGTENIRAASIMANAGAEGFAAMAAQVDKAGAAADLNAKQNDSLAGGIDALKSTVQTAAIMYGQTFGPSVRKAAGWLSDLTSTTVGAEGASGRLFRTLVTGTTVVLAGAAAYLKVSTAVVVYRAQLAILRTQSVSTAASQGLLTTALGKVATALGTSTLGVGIAAVAVAGLAVELYYLKQRYDAVSDAADRAAASIDNSNRMMADAASRGYLSQAQADQYTVKEKPNNWDYILAGIGIETDRYRKFYETVERQGFADAVMGNSPTKRYRDDQPAGSGSSGGAGGTAPATSLAGLGGDGKSGGGSQAAKRQKTAAELQAEAEAKLLKQKQDELAATEARIRIIKAGSQAAEAQATATSKAAASAKEAEHSVRRAGKSGEVFNKAQAQCAEAVTTIYQRAGVLSQVYTITTQASKAMLEHPDRFQRLKPGEALQPGDYVSHAYQSGVGAFSGREGWHSMMVLPSGEIAGAPHAGSQFQVQYKNTRTLPEGWVGFRPSGGQAAGGLAGLEAQRDRLQDEIAKLQGGPAGLQLQAERAEAAAKAQEESSQAAKAAAAEAQRAAEERRQAQIERIEREGAGQLVQAEARIYQAEQGRSLAGPGYQSQAWQETLSAHEAYWQTREDTARKLADITGDTTELERVQLENARERSQLLDGEIERQRQIREEKRRQAEEAERQEKAARLEKSSDAATLAGIMAERAQIQGASAQTQAALEKKSQGLQLRHAAELARQGQVIESERIRNEVLRQQLEGGTQTGRDALQEAVIGGDMGRISDILQQGRRAGGGRAGSAGDDDPVAYAIRNGRSQQPRIIAGAVDERLRREALETARLIEDS